MDWEAARTVNLSSTTQDIIAVGKIDITGYNRTSGGFLSVTLYKPDDYQGNRVKHSNGVELKAGLKYYIGSWEQPGSDPKDRAFGWPDDFPRLTTGSGLTVLGPARCDNTKTDSSGLPDLGANQANLRVVRMDLNKPDVPNSQGYGPLNMIYDQTDDAARTLFSSLYFAGDGLSSGYQGIKIKTGRQPVMVTALGRYCKQTNDDWHHLIVQRAQPAAGDLAGRQSQVLAQTVVKADWSKAASNGGYNYAKLEQPLVLEPCTEYYIASYESSAQDNYPICGSGTISGYNFDVTGGLFGYSGYAPGPISSGNTYFEVDDHAWVLNDTGYWTDQGANTFLANVNVIVQ